MLYKSAKEGEGETSGKLDKKRAEGLGKKLVLLKNGLIVNSLTPPPNPNPKKFSVAGENIAEEITGKFAGDGDKIPGICPTSKELTPPSSSPTPSPIIISITSSILLSLLSLSPGLVLSIDANLAAGDTGVSPEKLDSGGVESFPVRCWTIDRKLEGSTTMGFGEIE